MKTKAIVVATLLSFGIAGAANAEDQKGMSGMSGMAGQKGMSGMSGMEGQKGMAADKAKEVAGAAVKGAVEGAKDAMKK